MEEIDKDNQILIVFLKDSVNVMNCPYFPACISVFSLACLNLFWCPPHNSRQYTLCNTKCAFDLQQCMVMYASSDMFLRGFYLPQNALEYLTTIVFDRNIIFPSS